MQVLKSYLILFFLFIVSSEAIAQKKEKIKGSKFVTVSQHEIPDFNTIEVNDDIEIHLIASSKPQIEIEADDNLHDNVVKTVTNNRLILNTTLEVTGAKRFIVRVLYTPTLQLVEAKATRKLTLYKVLIYPILQ